MNDGSLDDRLVVVRESCKKRGRRGRRGTARIWADQKHSLMGYGIHNSGRMGAFKQTLVPVTRAEMETPTALAVALALRLALLMVASIDTPIPGMPGVPGTAGVSMQTFLTQRRGRIHKCQEASAGLAEWPPNVSAFVNRRDARNTRDVRTCTAATGD